jgi:hypothetical protein
VLHLSRLQPYGQALEKAGKACQGQTLAFYENPLFTAVNFFIVQAPEVMNMCAFVYIYICI